RAAPDDLGAGGVSGPSPPGPLSHPLPADRERGGREIGAAYAGPGCAALPGRSAEPAVHPSPARGRGAGGEGLPRPRKGPGDADSGVQPARGAAASDAGSAARTKLPPIGPIGPIRPISRIRPHPRAKLFRFSSPAFFPPLPWGRGGDGRGGP